MSQGEMMKLFPRRRQKARENTVTNHQEAEEAVQQSEANLQDTLSMRVEVERIASRLQRARQQDHFAATIRRLMIGGER